MKDLLNLIGEQLQPIDVEKLKYILWDSFTGKFDCILSLPTCAANPLTLCVHKKVIHTAFNCRFVYVCMPAGVKGFKCFLKNIDESFLKMLSERWKFLMF